MARFIQCDVDQVQMLFLSLADLFGPESREAQHLALIRRLDLSKFEAVYINDSPKGGRPAMPPDRMIALLAWDILNGGKSMRKLARRVKYRADYIFLA